MEKDFLSLGKDLKRGFDKKVLPTILAGALIFSNGGESAKAFSLDEPTITYEEFLKYDGIKVFINGRYVEFNDDLGYPYAVNGRTMIPLRAVAETFNAQVGYNHNTNVVNINKLGQEVRVKIGTNEIEHTKNVSLPHLYDEITIDAVAVAKNGRTYVPLRAIFECFGMQVRWEGETNSAHIETLGADSFPYIDFKDKKIISIRDLKLDDVNEVVYDGKIVSKSYVEILKLSDQYKVFVSDGKAYIFSYQYLMDINNIYEREKYYQENVFNNVFVSLYYASEEEVRFFEDVHYMDFYQTIVTKTKTEMEFRGTNYHYKPMDDKEQYDQIMKVVMEIVNEIKAKTSDKKEQVRLANSMIVDRAESVADGPIMTNAYHALVVGRSACAGFQSAFKLVMDELGIPCVCVDGMVLGTNTAHARNEVYIDGQWYVVDVFVNDMTGNKNAQLLVPADDPKVQDLIPYDDEAKENLDIFKLTYKFN